MKLLLLLLTFFAQAQTIEVNIINNGEAVNAQQAVEICQNNECYFIEVIDGKVRIHLIKTPSVCAE